MSVIETERDNEIMLVLTRMQQFPKGSPEHQRLQAIWHESALTGALREDFPRGTEALKAKWEAIVVESRAATV